jgi:hypothetical protein
MIPIPVNNNNSALNDVKLVLEMNNKKYLTKSDTPFCYGLTVNKKKVVE